MDGRTGAMDSVVKVRSFHVTSFSVSLSCYSRARLTLANDAGPLIAATSRTRLAGLTSFGSQCFENQIAACLAGECRGVKEQVVVRRISRITVKMI